MWSRELKPVVCVCRCECSAAKSDVCGVQNDADGAYHNAKAKDYVGI